LKKLVDISADLLFTVNTTTGVIVSSDKNALDLMGEDFVGSQLHRAIRDTDCAHVNEWLKQTAGDPSEAFLATLCCRRSQQFTPTGEFEARVIPYDVAGPLVHVCLHMVGEVRIACHAVPTSAAFQSSCVPEQPPEGGGPGPAMQLSDDICSFDLSSTAMDIRPQVPGTRTVEVQTLPTEVQVEDVEVQTSSRPPSIPKLSRDVNTLRAAGVPWARRAKRQTPVRRNTSRRQVPEFVETPRRTAVMRMVDAMGGINACGSGCCSFHVSAASARRALKDIQQEGCKDMLFGTHQCPECLALIHELSDAGELQECDTCGAQIYPLPPTRRASASSEDISEDIFCVTVDRSDGARLGIEVDTRLSYAVFVERVAGGLFAQWNDRNEEAKVRKGDYLVKVNGISGNADQILAECAKFKPLEIVVVRGSRWPESNAR